MGTPKEGETFMNSSGLRTVASANLDDYRTIILEPLESEFHSISACDAQLDQAMEKLAAKMEPMYAYGNIVVEQREHIVNLACIGRRM